MSEIRVDSITDEVGTSSPDFPNGILKSSMPSGSVIQVVSTTKTDTFSESVPSLGISSVVTGLSVSITPTSTSSKVLIIFNIQTGTQGVVSYLVKDGNVLSSATGDADGSRRRVTGVKDFVSSNVSSSMVSQFLDSPSSTNELTYGLKLASVSGSTRTLYVNRSESDLNNGEATRPISTITVMEIAG